MDSLKVKKELCVILVLVMLFSMFACSMFMMDRVASEKPYGQSQEFVVSVPQLLGADRVDSVLQSFKDARMLDSIFVSLLNRAKVEFVKLPIFTLGSYVTNTFPLKTLKYDLLTFKNKLKTYGKAGIFAWPDVSNQFFHQLE